MSVPHKRVVVALPRIGNAAMWQRIVETRSRFDPLAHAIAPHLTLASIDALSVYRIEPDGIRPIRFEVLLR